MAFVVTLEDFVPPPRADGIAFTHARVEESAAQDGVFVALASLPLSPLDSDPSQPEPRELTLAGTIAEGWYRVVWTDASGRETASTPPIQNTAELPGGTRPSVMEVAALLRARTKVTGGRELGTFTEATRPTSREVGELIDEAADEVLGKVQAPTEGSDYERRVKRAIRLYSAILIETSYFPEQVKSGQSAATVYQQLYSSRVKALIAEGETGNPQGEGGSGPGGGSPGDAAWTFPENQGGMVGLGSRW